MALEEDSDSEEDTDSEEDFIAHLGFARTYIKIQAFI